MFFVGTLFPALGFLNVYPFRYSYVADHFHPNLWLPRGRGQIVFDPAQELAMTRHQGGANYIFVDGHAHWYRFEQTFDLAAGVNWYNPGG